MKALITVLMLFAAQPMMASDPAPAAADTNPLTAHGKHMYDVGVRQIVTRAAEAMPEEHYAFRPVDGVRTFGEILAHVADTQYVFCSVASGVERPGRRASGSATKAELLTDLDAAFDYCASAYGLMDDTRGRELVRIMGSDTPRLGVLNINTTHTIEHYGNLVTYMRMKGLVPPTSDPEFMKSLHR